LFFTFREIPNRETPTTTTTKIKKKKILLFFPQIGTETFLVSDNVWLGWY